MTCSIITVVAEIAPGIMSPRGALIIEDHVGRFFLTSFPVRTHKKRFEMMIIKNEVVDPIIYNS